MRPKFFLKNHRLSQHLLLLTVILVLWEILLLINHAPWQNLLLLAAGAVVGYLILELDWFFPQKEIKKMLPLILLPLTIFILTSTPGVFGKALIIFFNLRLLLDNYIINKDNENRS